MDVLKSLLGTLVLISIIVTVESLSCLHCDETDSPRHCSRVTECSDGEMCNIKRMRNEFGDVVFRLGCLSSCRNVSIGHCSFCCSSDLCNNQGCGEDGYPDTRGPICYSCASRLPHHCHDIEFCDIGQVCNVVGRDVFGEQLLTSHCAYNHSCNAGQQSGILVGKRSDDFIDKTLGRNTRTSHVCDKCCTQDLCNGDCGQSPINGAWTNWSSWSMCSVSCGNGTETRTRSCSNPPPSHGGADCSGSGDSLRSCDTCPGPFDCLDILQSGRGNTTGVYTVTLRRTHRQIQVFCDQTTDGGGWTVFQRRIDGSVDFYLPFHDYETGFGNVSGEFWLGLSYLQEMVSRTDNHTFRIDVKAGNGGWGYDVYSNFSLSPGRAYTLHIGDRIDSFGMNPSIGIDSTGHPEWNSNNCAFSTYDMDQDQWMSGNCAEGVHSAWWFNSCSNLINFNGPYSKPGSAFREQAFYYDAFIPSHMSLKEGKLMFR